MSGVLRIVTSPLPAAAGLGFAELSVAVAADALARRAVQYGTEADLRLPLLSGDHGGQLALDRTGRPATELALFERARLQVANEQLAALDVQATLDEGAASAAVREAAVVAFVRLYEEGLIELGDHVATVCPSCATVIEGPDAAPGTVEAERLEIVLAGDEVELRVLVVAPELFEGAVAVAVPIGDPAAGLEVVLPLDGRRVPVVAEMGRVERALVVPAHSRDGHEFARHHGLESISVLGEDGVVLGDGPLGGLNRYAARQAARALLEAEGVVAAVTGGDEAVERCRHCGSIGVCVLGRHWALIGGNLEVGAADAVRDGLVTFQPHDARDAFLLAATSTRPWCLDRHVAGGIPLPVSTCNECGRTSVDATPSTMCGKCLGELEPEPATLDARFVAAIWPLALHGWPHGTRSRGRRWRALGTLRRDGSGTDGHGADASTTAGTVAVVAPEASACWALPALALGRHLSGTVPMETVIVQPAQGVPEGVDVEALLALAANDARAARLMLLSGDLDLDARTLLAGLDEPAGDDHDVTAAAEAAAAALDDVGPGHGTALLIAALGRGVPASDAARVRAAAEPMLGRS